jgi:hypothetical protein
VAFDTVLIMFFRLLFARLLLPHIRDAFIARTHPNFVALSIFVCLPIIIIDNLNEWM